MSAAILLRFEFEAEPDLRRPWPVQVDSAGLVSAGRPDAERLLGFQRDLDVQRVDLTFDQAIEALGQHPHPAVGMFAVYFGHLGAPGVNDVDGIFVVGNTVAAVTVIGPER